MSLSVVTEPKAILGPARGERPQVWSSFFEPRFGQRNPEFEMGLWFFRPVQHDPNLSIRIMLVSGQDGKGPTSAVARPWSVSFSLPVMSSIRRRRLL
jgi:hypothetical protein